MRQHYETTWDTMRYHETAWDTMRYHKTLWDTIRHYETTWDTMRHHETPWDIIRCISWTIDQCKRPLVNFPVVCRHPGAVKRCSSPEVGKATIIHNLLQSRADLNEWGEGGALIFNHVPNRKKKKLVANAYIRPVLLTRGYAHSLGLVLRGQTPAWLCETSR